MSEFLSTAVNFHSSTAEILGRYAASSHQNTALSGPLEMYERRSREQRTAKALISLWPFIHIASLPFILHTEY